MTAGPPGATEDQRTAAPVGGQAGGTRALLRALAAPAALAVLLGLAVQATWPFARHPTSTVIAPLGFDTSSGIAKFAAIAREGTTPFTDGVLHSIAVPDGVPLSPGVDAASALSSAALWIGAGSVGSIAAFGLMALLGLFLSGAVMFAFVRWLTGSAGAGLVAGIAAGFFPHLRLMAIAAPTYTHIWLYVLPIWAFTALLVAPTARRAALAGASALPALFWTPYYTAHVLVEMLACGVVAGVVLVRRIGPGATVRIAGWVAGPLAAGLVVYLAVGVLTSFRDVPGRDPGDFYVQSAHPLMYAVPGYASRYWGHGPYDRLVEAVPRAVSTNLYLGVSVLALAVIGGFTVGRRRHGASGDGCGDRMQNARLLAGAVALTALAWSLPPTIGVAGLDVPMPSRLTTELVPAIRAGQRFVMLVMAALSVLAGVGAAWLLRRTPPPARLVVVAGLAALVGADLAVAPFEPAARVPDSPALAALREAPAAPAIHYQSADPANLVAGAVARPCVLQPQHGKPLVNGCNLTLAPAVINRLYALGDPSSCVVMRRLAALGVRYVILDHGVPAPRCGDRPSLPLLAADAGFRVLRLAPLAPGSG